MEAVEIVRIKDVIIEKVSANDEELEHIFGCSKRQAGDMRREMKKLPSQQKHLGMMANLSRLKVLMLICNTEELELGRKKWRKARK